MIERLLAAEGALARDELDHAQHLYEQVVAADPRNAIAVVGLARVAAQRGDREAARAHLEHALGLDPDEAAARRLLVELDTPADEAPPADETAPAEEIQAAPAETIDVVPAEASAPARRSLVDRLLGWLGLRPRA